VTPVTPVWRHGVPRLFLRILARVWIAALIIGSLQPARPGVVRGFHREMHWVAFGGAVLPLLFLARSRSREILAVCGMILLGVTLEILQHLIYANAIEWRDMADDGAAVLAAFALYYLATCRRRPKDNPAPTPAANESRL